jgi:hypothetical protein
MSVKTLPPLEHEWQYLERHETQVRAVLKADGCMDDKNQLRSWHGKKSNDALDAAGHPTLDYKSCSCHPKNT